MSRNSAADLSFFQIENRVENLATRILDNVLPTIREKVTGAKSEPAESSRSRLVSAKSTRRVWLVKFNSSKKSVVEFSVSFICFYTFRV